MFGFGEKLGEKVIGLGRKLEGLEEEIEKIKNGIKILIDNIDREPPYYVATKLRNEEAEKEVIRRIKERLRERFSKDEYQDETEKKIIELEKEYYKDIKCKIAYLAIGGYSELIEGHSRLTRFRKEGPEVLEIFDVPSDVWVALIAVKPKYSGKPCKITRGRGNIVYYMPEYVSNDEIVVIEPIYFGPYESIHFHNAVGYFVVGDPGNRYTLESIIIKEIIRLKR